MAKSRKSIVKPRTFAFSNQNGRCYYCNQPMSSGNLSEFSSKFAVSQRQAMILKCTGEHLVAFKDGGSSARNNIVAACWFCNNHRHRRKTNPSPEQYKRMVQQRLDRGRWHGLILAA
jgi:5-methylcytosine-specific restriction endonuclease McrA